MFSAHGENWLHGERINSTGGGKVVLEFPVSVTPAGGSLRGGMRDLLFV